jgi:ribosome biogenesis GTPase
LKNQISNQLRAQLAHLEADSLRQLISRAQAMRDRSDKRPKEPLDTWVQRALRQEDRRREAIQDTQLGQVIGTFGNTCRAEVDRKVYDVAFAGSFCIVGDWIRFGENKTGEQQVVEVLPRRTKLSRPDVGGANKEKLIVANVDRVVIVVSVVSPPLHPRLIDRYLVAIQQGGAKPLLCVNKIDLLEDRTELDVLEPYRLAGVAIIVLSTRTQEGTAQLREALTGQTCVFVGHSGVGKSSLVNALLATPTQEVRGVSEGYGRGRHTTTASSLHHLGDETVLIDTPGIRGFGIQDLEATEIGCYFPEFAKFACRFNDCQHIAEPGCGVLQAVLDGELDPARYDTYRRLHAELG